MVLFLIGFFRISWNNLFSSRLLLLVSLAETILAQYEALHSASCILIIETSNSWELLSCKSCFFFLFFAVLWGWTFQDIWRLFFGTLIRSSITAVTTESTALSLRREITWDIVVDVEALGLLRISIAKTWRFWEIMWILQKSWAFMGWRFLIPQRSQRTMDFSANYFKFPLTFGTSFRIISYCVSVLGVKRHRLNLLRLALSIHRTAFPDMMTSPLRNLPISMLVRFSTFLCNKILVLSDRLTVETITLIRLRMIASSKWFIKSRFTL